MKFDPIRQVHKILGNAVEKEVKILDATKIPAKFSTFCTTSVEVSAILGDVQAGLGVQVPSSGVARQIFIVPLTADHGGVVFPRSTAPWEPCMISMLGGSEFPLRRDFPSWENTRTAHKRRPAVRGPRGQRLHGLSSLGDV